MIEHLVKKSDVHIYTLAPFIEFGDDLASLGLESPARSHATRRGRGRRRGDPADLPIVAQWGRPGREYFRMLDQIDGADFQSDLRARRVIDGSGPSSARDLEALAGKRRTVRA